MSSVPSQPKRKSQKPLNKPIHVRCTDEQRDSLAQIAWQRAAAGSNTDLSSMLREAIDDWISKEQGAISSSRQWAPIQPYLTKPQRREIARTVFHEAIALRSFAHQEIQTSLQGFQRENEAAHVELRKGMLQAFAAIESSLKSLGSRVAALEGYATDFPSQSAAAFRPTLSEFEEKLTRIEALSAHIDRRTSAAYDLAARLESLLEQAKELADAASRPALAMAESPSKETSSTPRERADISSSPSSQPSKTGTSAAASVSEAPSDIGRPQPRAAAMEPQAQSHLPHSNSPDSRSPKKASAPSSIGNEPIRQTRQQMALELFWEQHLKPVVASLALPEQDKHDLLVLETPTIFYLTLVLAAASKNALAEISESGHRRPKVLAWPLYWEADTRSETMAHVVFWLVQDDGIFLLCLDQSWKLGMDRLLEIQKSMTPLTLSPDPDHGGAWAAPLSENRVWVVDGSAPIDNLRGEDMEES